MQRKMYFSAIVFLFLISGFVLTEGVKHYAPTIKTEGVLPTAEHYTPVTPPAPNNSGKFLIGCMNSLWDLPDHISYQNLGLNITHAYIGTEAGQYPGDPNRHTPKGWLDTNDHLFSAVPLNAIRWVLGKMDSYNQTKFMWQRPKIEWLCYGQSSTYKAVQDNADLWFYSFNVRNGSFFSDVQWNNGKTVLDCSDISLGPNAQFVLQRLKANTEQSRAEYDGTSNQWQADNECDWLVKPRIRIDSMFARTHLETPVCKIKVLAQDGSTVLKETVIKAKNFLDQNLQYNGRYLEQFNFPFPNDTNLTIHGAWGNSWTFSARGAYPENQINNHTDIQVYWYDNCELWIDYVKVENDVADELMNPNNPNFNRDNQWITDEVNAVKDPVTRETDPSVYNFYIEGFEFNNIPCMAYVNNKIKTLSNNKIGLMADQLTFYQYHVNWNDLGKIMTADQIKREYIDKLGATQVFGGSYPFTARDSANFSEIPNTLPVHNGSNLILANDVSPATYDDWLQYNLDTHSWAEGQGGAYVRPVKPGGSGTYCAREPQYEGYYRFSMKLCSEISKAANIPFIAWGQAHQWHITCGEIEREPTAEECDLLANIPVSYGAKGIIYFEWNSFGTPPNQTYTYGLTQGPSIDSVTPRLQNVYQQPKWSKYIEIVQRLKKWEPYTMSFDNTQTNSYVLRLDYSTLTANSYFSDVFTYASDINHPGTAAPLPEPVASRYMQAATFKNTNETYSNYFMLVNKRCSPVDPNYNDGRRDVRVQFKTSSLAGFNNWKIINLYDYSTVTTFDKNAVSQIDLGWYNPGEGRLYKLAPVMQEGGTLIADESFGPASFNCNGKVYNNNKNITINGNTSTISFADTATIIMNGGTFLSSSSGSGPIQQKNTFLSAVSGHHWKGLQFTGSTVQIYNAKFQDVDSTAVRYSVNCADCPLTDIRYSTFIASDTMSGGVNIIYFTGSDQSLFTYVKNNTFTMNDSRFNALQVQAFAGLTVNVYIENNSMTSNGNSTGIFVSTITGGAISYNSITGFATGINSLLSTTNILGNTISNTSAVSKGIIATGYSSLTMNPSGTTWVGGLNTITNTSGFSHNIEVNNSIFTMDGGNNTFDIPSSIPVQTYHLIGSFWNAAYTKKQTGNCFKLGGTAIVDPALPNNSVSDSAGIHTITFTFLPYACNRTPPGGTSIVSIGHGLYDTIPTGSGGSGGEKMSNVNLNDMGQMSNVEHQTAYFTITSSKTLYDSVQVQMRYRNYSTVKTLCYELINTYPDSMESVASLQTLFMASNITDTTTAGITALKTFYENLILNHGSNITMVTISNYLAQKCKVLLRQYSSAMSGFQQIINNNQYNYEGLLARWDYMATSLLLQGSGGGEIGEMSNVKGQMSNDEEPYKLYEPYELYEPDDDKSPFTKEERKIIKETLSRTNGINKNIDEVKVQILQKRSDEGDAIAGKELKTMKILKDVIKTELPKNIAEHMRIVNSDIQKVFGSGDVNTNGSHNQIPSVFMLHQNYPNPFNPSATIKYDLPKDSRVTIKIYDIIGREVRTLVNEFKKAGYYQAIFDGTNLASGVYFYRIEAGEFVDSKKMVLVK